MPVEFASLGHTTPIASPTEAAAGSNLNESHSTIDQAPEQPPLFRQTPQELQVSSLNELESEALKYQARAVYENRRLFHGTVEPSKTSILNGGFEKDKKIDGALAGAKDLMEDIGGCEKQDGSNRSRKSLFFHK